MELRGIKYDRQNAQAMLEENARSWSLSGFA
jgi:hypothetical protein